MHLPTAQQKIVDFRVVKPAGGGGAIGAGGGF